MSTKNRNHRSRPGNEQKTTNRHILLTALVLGCCMSLAVCTLLYTMATGKHLWSQNSALNPLIRSSVQTRVDQGVRGTITDRNGEVLARQATAYTIAANFDNRTDEEKEAEEQLKATQRANVLKQAEEQGRTEQVEAALKVADQQETDQYVTDIPAFAAAIKSVLGDSVDEENIVDLLKAGEKNNRSQIELGPGTKRITREQKERLESLKIPGMTFIEDVRREYPITPMSSNMLGFAAYDDETGRITGKLGLEQTLESYIGAENGETEYQSTKLDQILPGSEVVVQEKTNGDNVKLTLDANLQQTVEHALQIYMDQSKAQKSWCLVMEPETGKILAWASYPTFDQNLHMTIDSFYDNISQYPLEPGSVVKPLFYSMALDAGVYPWNETYRAGIYYYKTDETTGQITRVDDISEASYPGIFDALQVDYGTLTFAEGLAHSSNIALCELLTKYLNQKQVQKYVDAFHLYQPTDIDYVPEITGTKNNTQASDYLSSGFGQASSMTILDLAQAYTAIFNDGMMMKPYVVDSITDPTTGSVIQKFEPKVVSVPISATAAAQTRDLMRGVTAEGMTGEKFAMDGVDMALKTGTGEIYNPETGTYDKDLYTSSMVAAIPADDPKVMVIWGMQSTDYLSYDAQPVIDIINASLKATNINTGSNVSVTEPYQEWNTYEMPALSSHSLDYALSRMSDKQVNTVVIGDGDSIVGQFPKAGTTINSNDNVLLLTNGANRTMPDMIGWTRKDITAYWQLTGISISASGYGRTVWQSIEAGTPVQSDTVVEVRLE